MRQIPGNIILLLSNEPWGDVWYSKHHYANELAKENKVYFINPSPRWKFAHLFSRDCQHKEIAEGLTVIAYKNNFPVVLFKALFLKLNDFINSRKLKNLAGASGKRVILWQFDPFRFVDVYGFKSCKRIYHVVDPYDGASTDKDIAGKADLIVSVNREFMAHYKQHENKILHIPHGLNKEELMPSETEVEKIRKKYGSFFLLTGTVNMDIDLELLMKISKQFREHNLLIIGPVHLKNSDEYHQFDELIAQDNVHYIGIIPAPMLKNYAKASILGLVPYRCNEDRVSRTPLKIITYLSQKKPIISTITTNFESLRDKIIFHAEHHEIFLNSIRGIIDGTLKYDERAAEEYMKQIRYPDLIRKILNKLN